jgi:signal peptidase I
MTRVNSEKTEAGEKGEQSPLFCRGESMRPLFRPGDRIRFVSCRVEDLRRGDVIIFTPPSGTERVVHRVVSTGFGGIRTQGDANPCRDAWTLQQEDIVGCAVSIERRGRVIPVADGITGRLIAALIRAFRKSDHVASNVLSPCYRGLARSGLLGRLLPQALRPKVIEFVRDGAKEMHLVIGRRVVGRRLAGEEHWSIRRPYRVFVDEQALP